MKKTTIFLFCSMLSLNGFSQGLKLSKGGEKKVFKTGSIFKVVTIKYEGPDDEKCCDYEHFIGTITGISKDSLSFQLSEVVRTKTSENIDIQEVLQSENSSIPMVVSHKKILYIENYKSPKSMKTKDGFQIAGGLLLFTGVATALNAFLVHNKNSKNNLLISGGAQLGLGIGFLIMHNTKKYYINNTFEENKWVIDP